MSGSMLIRDTNGRFPAYAWPGGYQIIYVTADGGVLCPDCANRDNGSEASTDPATEPGWRLECCDVLYEGRIPCDHCGAAIVGSYED